MKKFWPALVAIALTAFIFYETCTGFGEMFHLSTVATEFAIDVREGRYEGAYACTSQPYHSMVTLAQFRGAVETNPYLRGANKVSFSHLMMNRGATLAKGMMTTSVGDVMAEFNFAKEGDAYRIAGVTLAGMPALVGR